MLEIYLSCLIFGGVFVLLSTLSGAGDIAGGDVDVGGDIDADADADVGVDADADVGADADLDAEVGGIDADAGAMEIADVNFDLEAAGLDTEVDAEADGADQSYERPGRDASFNPFLTFKFYTFFLAFFGLTGSIFEWLEVWNTTTGILALSIGMGSFAGLSMAYVIHTLKASEEYVGTNEQYIGASADVTIPFDQDTGEVRIQLEGSIVDMRARAFDEDEHFDEGETCFVMDVEDDGVAHVISAEEVKKQLT